jgi:hypothetical protein
MTTTAGYGSPGVFRRALTDRLRVIARESRWTLPQLQRQIAYDRLLERLYLVDDGWIVKGAPARAWGDGAELIAEKTGHRVGHGALACRTSWVMSSGFATSPYTDRAAMAKGNSDSIQ